MTRLSFFDFIPMQHALSTSLPELLLLSLLSISCSLHTLLACSPQPQQTHAQVAALARKPAMVATAGFADALNKRYVANSIYCACVFHVRKISTFVYVFYLFLLDIFHPSLSSLFLLRYSFALTKADVASGLRKTPHLTQSWALQLPHLKVVPECVKSEYMLECVVSDVLMRKALLISQQIARFRHLFTEHVVGAEQ